LATALAPKIGYRAATELAVTALLTGKTIRDSLAALTDLPGIELDRLIGDPMALTGYEQPE
jgi:fumarate hydratase class II